jgi:hypothetical protein
MARPYLRALVKLSPGVYDDGRGGMHIEMAELLTSRGFAVTEENQRVLAEAVREQFPGAVLLEYEDAG